MYRSIFVFLFLLFVLPKSALALEVRFHKSIHIKTPFVTLGDIAGFNEESPLSTALATQRIGYAPLPGESVTLSSKQIINELSQKLDHTPDIIWNGSPSILVNREGVTVNAKQMEADIAAFFEAQQNQLPEADYLYIPQQLPLPFLVPTGDLEVEVIPSNPNILGSRRFTLIYKVDGKIVKNISIRGRIQAMGDVAVLTRNVKRNEIITPDMVKMETKDLARLKDPCMDLREIIGKKMTRRGRGGRVLSIDNVDFPPVVQKGQLVKILVNYKSMSLTATGIASSNGKQDQVIRVKNTRSQKIIFCKVAAPGIVEVQI